MAHILRLWEVANITTNSNLTCKTTICIVVLLYFASIATFYYWQEEFEIDRFYYHVENTVTMRKFIYGVMSHCCQCYYFEEVIIKTIKIFTAFLCCDNKNKFPLVVFILLNTNKCLVLYPILRLASWQSCLECCQMSKVYVTIFFVVSRNSHVKKLCCCQEN